ncbi:MAG: response regulator [Homoserinimonas sp.]
MLEPTGGSVLIADDDSLVRMVLRMGIENLGHQAVSVGTFEELGTALSEQAFALCIMDVSMPCSSLEDRLDQTSRLAPEMPVMVLSGYSEAPETVREQGLRFLSKPISLDELGVALAGFGMGFAGGAETA